MTNTTTPTSLETIAAELMPKLIARPDVQAAALEGGDAFKAALEAALPEALEQHRRAMAEAFNHVARLAETEPTRVRLHFAPRILKALGA